MRRSEPLITPPSEIASSPPSEAYEVRIPPHVRAILDKAPRRSRTAIERKLQDAARLASLRQWVDHAEGQHPIRLQLAGYEGSYSIDPGTRQLTLWDLTRR
ncbi:hypothetical protein JRI60_31660 [Archangium violaceum]|uniref:hypothetical protein n=1 Tax=Archangium violaceum TaxID=83451 RepID=UPI00194E89DC|nr:hypothetical protein [Archangium violaceum]QRN93715.1 hypothetical protein JRI60_31660 [Archangium violaceum]